MDLVPKSILRTLDTLDTSIRKLDVALDDMANDDSIETNTTKNANRDITLALALTGLAVLQRQLKGEDPEEALVQFEKCKKAAEKFRETNAAESGKELSKSNTSSSGSQSHRREGSVTTSLSSKLQDSSKKRHKRS